MNHEYTLTLTEARASLATVGGKGASLARLASAGLPVPDGFYVTTAAYDRFVAENELFPRMRDILVEADPDKVHSLEAASRTIGALFSAGQMPAEIASPIARAYAELPGTDPAVAVRSSATAEDLPELSFAGQQETYLNIQGMGAVLEAVKRCWASLWTGRAIGYRLRHGVDQSAVSVAVVVQLLVPAEAAGILFTANPMTGAREEMVVSAAWGLGEAIVGGLVTPDTVTVEKGSLRVLSRQTAEKETMTVRMDGGTQERPVPTSLRSAPVLSDEAAVELARLGARIESLYGQPMDIEWTLTDGAFAIVQARPITALPPVPVSPPQEWPLPDPKGKYMRASIVDLMPSPLSPLFASLGIDALSEGIRRLGDEYFHAPGVLPEGLMVTIRGYAYMLVSYSAREWWHMLTQMLPKYPRLIRTGTRWWQEIMRPAYVRAVEAWRDRSLSEMTSSEILSAARALFDAVVDHLGSLMVGTMGISAGSEGLFTSVYQKLIRREGDPPAPVYLMGYDTTPIRAEKSLYDLAQWCADQPALKAHLLETPSEQLAAELEDAAAPRDMDAVAWQGWRERFEAHLERFGHIIYDFDFSQPLPRDEPEPMLETCKMYLRGEGADPHERQSATAERRECATRETLARLKGLKRWAFTKSLEFAQRLAQVREDGIADIGLAYPTLRGMFLELGRRLVAAEAIEQPKDVFWLTETELEEAVAALDSGTTPERCQAMVQERRAEREALRGVTPPPMLPPSDKYMGFKVDAFMAADESDQAAHKIKGLGASPGRVTARARVLHGPDEFGQMEPGEILVAGITTPAWTPLFAMAAGVVTDIGGPLSHGSIVAREYGIPAVLGTGVATRRIVSGQMITVDGNAGEVVLAQSSGESVGEPE